MILLLCGCQKARSALHMQEYKSLRIGAPELKVYGIVCTRNPKLEDWRHWSDEDVHAN